MIATVPGDFQTQIRCSGNWDPGCLRSWLEDPSGSGTYSFTVTLPQGSYQAKVAINESWTVNYGLNGVQNGANIPFTVQGTSAQITFNYDPASHVLTILGGTPSHDNHVEQEGLRHDSRDTLYRTPGGAVPAGTPVRIRFRTYHNDVTDVTLRNYDLNASAEQMIPMQIVASDVPCYQDGLGSHTCDYWETTLKSDVPDNYWYRFIVSDGTDTAYYADNTPALDGGLGSAGSILVDNSYALMFYDPAFKSANWAKNAVMYQVFPDRFLTGRHDNRMVRLRQFARDHQDPSRRAELFLNRSQQHHALLVAAGRIGLAAGCNGRPLFPERLLGNIPLRHKEYETKRLDHRGTVAEGLNLVAVPAWRSRRHYDELPAARRGSGIPGAAELRLQRISR